MLNTVQKIKLNSGGLSMTPAVYGLPRIRKKKDPAKTVADIYVVLDSERINELTIMGA